MHHFFLIYFFEKINNIKLKLTLLFLCIFSNTVFLLIVSLVPINGKVPIYKYLYYQDIKKEDIFYVGENPYLINEMEPFFYTHFIPKINELSEFSLRNNSYIITNDYVSMENIAAINKCKLVFSSYPLITNLNENWKKKKINWYINYCLPNN